MKSAFVLLNRRRVDRGGGGQVVTVLALYSDNLSSNPSEVNNIVLKCGLERTKRIKNKSGFPI